MLRCAKKWRCCIPAGLPAAPHGAGGGGASAPGAHPCKMILAATTSGALDTVPRIGAGPRRASSCPARRRWRRAEDTTHMSMFQR